jgi:hypothetical protein
MYGLFLIAPERNFTNEIIISWDVTVYSITDVSEEHAASIFRVEKWKRNVKGDH